MCFNCIALGPMITAFPGFKGCGATIGQCFMALPKGTYESKTVDALMDKEANAYLEDVLSDMVSLALIGELHSSGCCVMVRETSTPLRWTATATVWHMPYLEQVSGAKYTGTLSDPDFTKS